MDIDGFAELKTRESVHFARQRIGRKRIHNMNKYKEEITCKVCQKVFLAHKCLHKKFCSRECFYKQHKPFSLKVYSYKEGHIPHNKGLKGYSNKGTFKNGHAPVLDQWGEKNISWKGDEVGYSGLHFWVRKNLGTPSKCEHCKTTVAKRFEWANKSREYKRQLDDWIRLCPSCHHEYDRKNKAYIKYM